MSAQPSAAVKTASGKLGKFQKGIGKKAELIITPVRISGVFASWMSLGSAPLRLGREMVMVTEKDKEKSHTFLVGPPQLGNFRWEKG